MNLLDIPTDHELFRMSPGERTGLPVMIGVHSTLLGPAVGGCRLKVYDAAGDAVADCLRLSQAMTLKAAAIDNGTGGGKTVVPLPPDFVLTQQLRTSVLLDIADAVHALGGTYHVAPDIGTSTDSIWSGRNHSRITIQGSSLPANRSCLRQCLSGLY